MHLFSSILCFLLVMLRRRTRGQAPGPILELRMDFRRALGWCGDNTGGGDSGALIARSPIAFIQVRCGVNDTMPRPIMSMGRGSRSLLVLRSYVTRRRSLGRGLPLVKAGLAPPGIILCSQRRASCLRTCGDFRRQGHWGQSCSLCENPESMALVWLKI